MGGLGVKIKIKKLKIPALRWDLGGGSVGAPGRGTALGGRRVIL